MGTSGIAILGFMSPGLGSSVIGDVILMKHLQHLIKSHASNYEHF